MLAPQAEGEKPSRSTLKLCGPCEELRAELYAINKALAELDVQTSRAQGPESIGMSFSGRTEEDGRCLAAASNAGGTLFERTFQHRTDVRSPMRVGRKDLALRVQSFNQRHLCKAENSANAAVKFSGRKNGRSFVHAHAFNTSSQLLDCSPAQKSMGQEQPERLSTQSEGERFIDPLVVFCFQHVLIGDRGQAQKVPAK
jgi:hypothetical protein